MPDMIICGFSMEMEMAEEMGVVGKCEGCLYFDELNNGSLFCRQYDEVLDETKENCKDWIVDHR